MKCPSCGSESAGKFCNNCGAPLGGASCASCGAKLAPGARFCHACGTPLAAAAVRRPISGMVPWLIAGAAVVTLVVIAIAKLAPSAPAAGSAAAAAPFASGNPSAMPAPDISNMTPRQQADRLFDRIMSAAERGDSGEMRFFTPMALQAYQMLGAPDDHVYYDMGMIQAVNGNADSALADAAAIERHTPTNLLAASLRATVASMQKDQATLKKVYRTYLANFDKEMAANRPGYAEHRTALEALRDEARRVVNGTK